MGLLNRCWIRFRNFWIFFLIVVLMPVLPPKTTFPLKPFNITASKELKGSLELNNYLDNAEHLLEGRVYGPEALIARKNEVFTGIHGGEVIKITQDHITHVAKFGQPCEGIYEEQRCGRPLGLAFDTIGNNLIVTDAYYGIWQVDLTNGRKKLLISPHQIFDGVEKRKAKIFNSVAVDKRGNMYWTDSSSDFIIEDGVSTLFTNPSGRLFFYDRQKNESKVLIDELHFANGIALSPNEDFIVVAETAQSRILKYHLKGPKEGQSEVFLDGLPGLPDNLTPDSEGLWVPLVAARDSEHPQIFQSLSNFPVIRLFILRIVALLEIPFRAINNAFPNQHTQKILHYIGNFESMSFVHPKRTTILRVDWTGSIKGSLHGFDKSISGISHVLELEDSLLLGSPYNKYIGRVKLPKKPQINVRNVRYEGAGQFIEPIEPQRVKTVQQQPTTTPKPVTTTTTTTTPKPTTTTPKPKTTQATKPPPTPASKPPPTQASKAPPTQASKPPPTTAKPTTTTSKPTTTTTPKPTSATPKQTTTTTRRPTTVNSKAKENPAPIEEEIPKDTKKPVKEKLKVIKRGGEQGEL